MKRKILTMVVVMFVVSFFAINAFAEFYVIPVQNKCGPCKGTRSSGGRWCDNGDGTVTDMATCLVWLKYADWGGEKPWEVYTGYDDAHTRAGMLESGEIISTSGETVYLTDGSDVGDWRLPTKTELVGITIGDEYIRYETSEQFFEEVQGGYLSSSSEDFWFAMFVSMVNGNVHYYDKNSYYPVWPVRNAK